MNPIPAIEACLWRGLPAWCMRAADGAETTVLERGAQVVGWRTAEGRERLYVSPLAQCAEGAAIRGGVPVCFPQFAGRGSLPQHGIVRTRPWRIDEAARKQGRLCMLMADDEATRALWPHEFRLQLEVSLEEDSLRIQLGVENSGRTSFTFMAALHTYLAVDELSNFHLHGLPAGDMFDNTEKARRHFPGGAIELSRPLDEVHANVREPLRLSDEHHALAISNSGFKDVVVWNPGAERARAITDLPDDDWARFICVEAALIEAPHVLEPGACWSGAQELTVSR